jgi:hypothetical protein
MNPNSPEIEFIRAFLSNGPWAGAFAYAFREILRAWQADRMQAVTDRKEYNTQIVSALQSISREFSELKEALASVHKWIAK